MSTIEKINVLFKDGAAELAPITRKPTVNNLKHPREVLSNLLQAVKLLGGTDAKILITSGNTYQEAYAGITFIRPDTPLDAYDLSPYAIGCALRLSLG